MKRLLQLLLSIAVCLVFVSCAHAPQTSSAGIPAGVKVGSTATLPNGLVVEEFFLPNGLHIMIVPNHQAPVFNYQMWVHTGSVTEVLDPKLHRAGLAHLFEHMMFRGTPKNPGSTFNEKLSLGGVDGLNATTSYDRTNFFFSLPKDKLELGLELESDRFQNLALDDKMFHTEIGAVLGELKMDKDKPGFVASSELMELAFQKHPYGKDVIGEEADVRAFSPEEARYFYRRYYAPNNFTLLLVGDVDTNEALGLIQKYFGSMRHQDISTNKAPQEPAQTEARRKTLSHPAAQNESLRIGFHTPKDDHPDSAPLDVLSAMLGMGEGSMLQKSLIDGGLASSVHVYDMGLREYGLFEFIVELRPGVTETKVQEQIDHAIDLISAGKISALELSRAKNTLLLHSYFDFNSNSGIASALAEGLLTSGDYMRFVRGINETKKVSAADVKRVARLYLRKENSSTILMTPEKKNAPQPQ